MFDSAGPVIAYAVSCLSGFAVEPSDPRRESIIATIVARATTMFADGQVRRDPKGYVLVRARQ